MPPGAINESCGAAAIAIALLDTTTVVTVGDSVGVTGRDDVGVGVFVGVARKGVCQGEVVAIAVTMTVAVGVGVIADVLVGVARSITGVLVAVGKTVFVALGFAVAVRVGVRVVVAVEVGVARAGCRVGVSDERGGVPVIFARKFASVEIFIGLVINTMSRRIKPIANTAIPKIARLVWMARFNS